jgi:3-phenylpropionate/cinnamic acid dioxygenase small subunit
MEKSSPELRAALRDFYDDYAATLDADRIGEWPNFFTEDALYQVISRPRGCDPSDRGFRAARHPPFR